MSATEQISNIIANLGIRHDFAPDYPLSNRVTLIIQQSLGIPLKQWVRGHFHVEPENDFGRVVQFFWKDTEVVVVRTDYKEHFPYLKFMFGYGGLGIAINNCLEKMNVRFNITSFQLVSEDGGQTILSIDPQQIAKFLCLDYQKFCYGFHNEAQFILWLSDCFYIGQSEAQQQEECAIYPATTTVAKAYKMFKLCTVFVDKQAILDFFQKTETEVYKPKPIAQNIKVKTI